MSKSGTIEQNECLKAYCDHLQKEGHTIVGTFNAKKMRVLTKHGYINCGEDVFGKDGLGFDILIASHYEDILMYHFIQVKSVYSRAYYLALVKKWKDSIAHVYLAIYQEKSPKVPAKQLAEMSTSTSGVGFMGSQGIYTGDNITKKIDKFWFMRVA